MMDGPAQALTAAIAAGRLHHGLLFVGETPVTSVAATWLACAANSDAPYPLLGGVNEHENATCARIRSGVHPDVEIVRGEGASLSIPIEMIRTLVSKCAFAPHEARARFFIFEDATQLQGAAANALLKTLEEPPQRTHFILCTPSLARIMPTLRSRCERHMFSERSIVDSELALQSENLLRDCYRLFAAKSPMRAASDFTAAWGGDKPKVAQALQALVEVASCEMQRAAIANELDVTAAWARAGQAFHHALRAVQQANGNPTVSMESACLESANYFHGSTQLQHYVRTRHDQPG